MLIYLGFSALVLFALTLGLLVLSEISLLAATHLVLAGAALPLIFGAIAHFLPVLTRSSEPPRAVQAAPLLLQVTGLLTTLHFLGVLSPAVLNLAAGIALLACLGFAGWLIIRARRTLGKPHPGWRWYLAAILFLACGLALVPLMYYAWPEGRLILRSLHLHLNTLGFIGLTAIGTLQVLLPTVLSGPDNEATARLRQDLPLAVAGVLGVALGAALWWPLSVLGAIFLLLVAGRIALSWYRRYGWRTITSDGAAAALAGALLGFLLLMLFGVAHGLGLTRGDDAVAAFIVIFLLPLVTGALSQLLPVWFYPGRRTPERDRMRSGLIRFGTLRTLFFLTGGSLLAFGNGAGFWSGAAGVLLFLYGVLRSIRPSAQKNG